MFHKNFIKRLFVFANIVTVFLTFPLSVRAMEDENTDNNTKFYPQPNGIEIPSDPKEVGVISAIFPSREIEKSWDNLRVFTTQTINNIKKDPNKPKGIFFVHSLEDIMGATECFTKKWNETYPEKKRNFTGEKFHDTFSHEEFINHYITFLLAERTLISGSILAFNEKAHYNLRSTFSPVNFIIDVPQQCIAITERQDAGTPVSYFPLRQPNTKYINYDSYVEENSEKLITLDALIRFPNINASNDKLYNIMNEVAILSCAQKDGQNFRPNVVGVLINKSAPVPGFDYGNAGRNKEWAEAAEKFAKINNLPCIELPSKTKTYFSTENAKGMVSEWFDTRTDSIKNYVFKRNDFETTEEQSLIRELHTIVKQKLDLKEIPEDPEQEKRYIDELLEISNTNSKFKGIGDLILGTHHLKKDRTFLSSDEQLKTYGLIRSFKSQKE